MNYVVIFDPGKPIVMSTTGSSPLCDVRSVSLDCETDIDGHSRNGACTAPDQLAPFCPYELVDA
jgi:hypothetical protein